MKTPEEIADERIALNYGTLDALEDALARGFVDADGIRSMLIGAVEADREQREEPAEVKCIHCGRPIEWVNEGISDWKHAEADEQGGTYWYCEGAVRAGGNLAEAPEGTLHP